MLLEGTNVSEGRGTTRPFEVWGAPWLDTAALRARFARRRLPGCVLRDHDFQPTFHKWQGEVCRGFQLHVTDADRYLPYLTTLALLQDVVALHRDRFAWKQPPYEYVTDRLPIDVLTGDPVVRDAIESGADLRALAATWRSGHPALRSRSDSAPALPRLTMPWRGARAPMHHCGVRYDLRLNVRIRCRTRIVFR